MRIPLPISINLRSKTLGILILLIIFGVKAHGADNTSPGALLLHATPTSIGLEWPITGDDNHNAECRVQYRVQGEETWQPFMPLFRIDDENANTLAGSILFLLPRTTYEINLILSDPDGGDENRVESVITRHLPQWPTRGREFHVIPGASGGSGSLEDPFQGISAAQNFAEPGDIFWVHAGIYPGEIEFNISGEVGNYIVWKGAGDGEIQIEKIRIAADHIWLEGLTVRDTNYALLTYNAPEDVVITYNYFLGNQYAVYLNHGGSNWTITDNTIVGDQVPGACSGSECYSGEGIELAHSSGHVVAYNTISNVADGISYPGKNCDIFGNELFDLADDGIELDYGYANNRAWQNRISNPQNNGISFQPMNGSPWYVLRNQVAAPLESALKLRSGGRALIAHNTLVGWSGAMASGSGYLNQFQSNNNLWITIEDRYCWEDTSSTSDYGSIPFWAENLDYDGFDWGDFSLALKWRNVRYSDLEAFYAGTGLEAHGVRVNKTHCFENFDIPAPPPASMPLQYLTLTPSCPAVDAGTALTGINNNYLGSAPDMGAYELGGGLPYYGVRVTDFDGDGDVDGLDLSELIHQSAEIHVLIQPFAQRFGR